LDKIDQKAVKTVADFINGAISDDDIAKLILTKYLSFNRLWIAANGNLKCKRYLGKNSTSQFYIKVTIMKKTTLLLVLFAIAVNITELNAQLINDVKKLIGKKGSSLTEKDAAEGIKEALIKGTSEGVKTVSIVDGYYGNSSIKIPLPPEAKVIESKLRSMGFGKKVDEAIVSINRAAEGAAKEATPIFVAAIKNMSITDAMSIVKGTDDAATQYLNRTTSGELNTKFQPAINSSLDKVKATKYWKEIITLYNKIPFVQKKNPNLSEYVTRKAIDGLFYMTAQEEKKIRQDPAARTTDLLKKVFGK
jgi:hypothetical protein